MTEYGLTYNFDVLDAAKFLQLAFSTYRHFQSPSSFRLHHFQAMEAVFSSLDQINADIANDTKLPVSTGSV